MAYNIKKSIRFEAVLYAERASTEKTVRDGEQAMRGGATILRIFGGDTDRERLIKLALRLKETASKYNVPLIIDDSVTVSQDCDAHGVHILFDEAEIKKARSVLDGEKIIGVSVKTVEEAVKAQELGADYVEVATVFFTNGGPATVTKNYLKKICNAVSIPVVAAGGINYENVESLKVCGISGIAVSHSLFAYGNIERTASMLRYGADRAVLPESRLQGAIIDMDGTLLDSMKIWKEIGERYLKSVGAEPRPDLHDNIKALSLRQASSYFKLQYNVNLTTDEIHEQLREIVKNFYDNEVKLKPGAREFLEELKKRRVQTMLLTATERKQVEEILERFELSQYFDCIMTCDEFGGSKAHRAIFKEARHRIGTPSRTTWVFDDSSYAIAAAKRAELKVVAVYDEHSRRKWSIISDMADISVKSLNDFPFDKF